MQDTVITPGAWRITVADIIIDGVTVAHETTTYRPDGSIANREITHCADCQCWEE